jgi:hypothetical protein
MKNVLKRLQPIIHFVERLNRELCRNRQKQNIAISALAITAALVYALSVFHLNQQRNTYGKYVLVHLASTKISVGDQISQHNTKTFSMPEQFVLPSTRTSLPISLSATSDIGEGDVISTQNSSAEGESAAVPAGMRAVSIVPRVAMPALAPGTFVDIIANGQIIAAHGVVLSSLNNNIGVVVAVPELSAPAVASAAAIGEAALVISN